MFVVVITKLANAGLVGRSFGSGGGDFIGGIFGGTEWLGFIELLSNPDFHQASFEKI